MQLVSRLFCHITHYSANEVKPDSLNDGGLRDTVLCAAQQCLSVKCLESSRLSKEMQESGSYCCTSFLKSKMCHILLISICMFPLHSRNEEFYVMA